jgi:hypothetical protein
MAKNWRSMRRLLDRDELLRRAGLAHRSPAGDFFAGLALFSMGVLVGAGMGMLFAPRRGDEIRAAVSEAIRRGRSAVPEAYRDLGAEASPAPRSVS